MQNTGDVIGGRFKIVEAKIHPHPKVIIHEVEDLNYWQRPCWLKLYVEARVRYREQLEACKREVMILQRLTNRCIIQVLDSDWLPGGHFFVLVPKLDGQVMFFAVMQPNDPRNHITVPKAVRLALQLVDAIEEAFAAGVLHRNLHPRGMYFCTNQQLLKILDFGFARMVDVMSAGASGAGAETLAYRAPEVVRCADNADIRSEIYSIGANLYFWLAGCSPFEEVGFTDLERAIFTQQPMSIRARRRDDAVPAELDRIVLRCLAKQPDERYQSTDELYSALEAVKRMLSAREDDESAKLAYPTRADLCLDSGHRREVHDVARAVFGAGFDFTLDVELRDANRLIHDLREHDRRLVRRLSVLADRRDVPPELLARLSRLREMKILT